MKKKISVIILIIIIIITIIFCFMIIKNTTLNKSEKEVFSVLQDLDYSLRNPIIEENNENNTSISFKPTSPTSVKELINNIYEVRKGYNQNGVLVFLFNVSILDENNNEMTSILCVIDGRLASMTLDENLSKFLSINQNTEESEDNNIFSGIYTTLIESGIKSLNDYITNLWNESATINNINLQKVFNKL